MAQRIRLEPNASSSVELYVVIIAASIPILVPLFRWVGEKLSSYRYSVRSWTARMKRIETTSQSGQQSSKKNPNTQSEEHILPIYTSGSGRDLEALTNHDTL